MTLGEIDRPNIMMRTRLRPGGMDKYDYSILEVCETLHMAKTGAADPLPLEESIKLRAYLLTRQLDWHKSHSSSEAYDNAVFALIYAVLKEYE